ncbi:MAG: type 1 fimbrial protein [Limnohabitans sp.]|nr:MAG: type 1 fimbrial protein [Limnohabitans sp.]
MKKFSLIAALMTTALMNVAHAGDGTINISGTVSDSTCKINGNAQNGTSVSSLTINLGTVSKADFAATGKLGNVVTGNTASGYNVALTSCPANATVSLTLDGIGSIDAATGTYKNTTSGGAGNINAQIVNAEGGANTALDPFGGNKISKTTDASGSANFLLGARYYATGAATAGSFTTTAGFSVIYN